MRNEIEVSTVMTKSEFYNFLTGLSGKTVDVTVSTAIGDVSFDLTEIVVDPKFEGEELVDVSLLTDSSAHMRFDFAEIQRLLKSSDHEERVSIRAQRSTGEITDFIFEF
ncbi:hypothetical protein OS242_10680 [Tumebacillus sp. DT12]|uniref:Adhesin domain-containing protein n=1 Tax=Tumebacillus lacus TaxID=2995335 RepID=A0ABT3X386_9BACL|nr:hypothetical protein [Tumebacillus lacus]MCX7570428.1 hypothetical protein [Tumebacillus lacus]